MTTEPKKGTKIRDVPIEEHSTAAWANVEHQKPVSKVPVPSIDNVEWAREWVNKNRK
ncbi:MAG: DUF3787 domain-containing protein [Bacillota bacterium]|nr:DUF3787 domain-containing protein [Bacillota bacterium]HHT90785.1 DUF3787 domain-containing protein [Bacillota bacterium]